MPSKTRTDYSILNILTGLGGYFINTLLGLICRMVFTRTLAADYLGINGLFGNILSMLSLAELGIGTAIVYALYKPLATDDRPQIASLVRFYGQCYRVIGVVVGIAGLCLMPFLNVLIREPPNISENLHVIYLLFLFNTASTYFFSYRSSLLMAAQQNYLVTGLSYIVTISQSIIQMVLLFLTHNYMLYLLVQTAGTLFYNVLISNIAKKRFPFIADKNIAPLEKNQRRSLIRNVRALTITKVAGMMVNQTDNIIITYFSGLATTGYASNYTLLSGTLNSLLNQLFNGISASVGNHNAIETKEHKLQLFYSINLANFWLFGWAAIGIFLVSNDLVALLFGKSFVLSLSISFVIALNFYMVGMQSAVWTYGNTMGLFRQGRYLLFLTAAINLACSIWLGKCWGLFGILIATAISRACTNTWYDPYKVFKYGFGEPARKYFKRYFEFAGLLVLCGGICYFLCSLCKFGLWGNVLVKFVICSFIPNSVFYLVFRKRPEFAYLEVLAKRVINKVFRRSVK